MNNEFEKHYIESLYYQLELTAKYCKFLGIQVFRKLNLLLSPEEFVTLDTIQVYGKICQRDLAKLILKDRPSTGRILNSLEKKGYIERFADTKNNRLIRTMSLTTEGKNELKRITQKLKGYLKDRLPKEFSEKNLKGLIKQIQDFRTFLETQVEVNI